MRAACIGFSAVATQSCFDCFLRDAAHEGAGASEVGHQARRGQGQGPRPRQAAAERCRGDVAASSSPRCDGKLHRGLRAVRCRRPAGDFQRALPRNVQRDRQRPARRGDVRGTGSRDGADARILRAAGTARGACRPAHGVPPQSDRRPRRAAAQRPLDPRDRPPDLGRLDRHDPRRHHRPQAPRGDPVRRQRCRRAAASRPRVGASRSRRC